MKESDNSTALAFAAIMLALAIIGGFIFITVVAATYYQ